MTDTAPKPGDPNGATFRSQRVLPYQPEAVFLELHAPSRVVIQHGSAPRYMLTVTLAAHEAGTAITWAQQFEDAAVAARIRHIVEPANEQNLDRLRSVLAGVNAGTSTTARPAAHAAGNNADAAGKEP